VYVLINIYYHGGDGYVFSTLAFIFISLFVTNFDYLLSFVTNVGEKIDGKLFRCKSHKTK